MKIQINELVRPSIRRLQPYSSARDESNPGHEIYLDANENPFGLLNRYPDPYQRNVKEAISAVKHIPAEHIFLGNGSDEIIDLLYRVFCQPGEDQVMICPPTYGMYEVIAAIHDISVVRIPLTPKFELDTEKILVEFENNPRIKLIFLCSPNNPTGNTLIGLDKILPVFKGIVVIDEAYIDFSDKPSYTGQLNRYPNLVVLQTLSKAWGLASVRLGMAFAGKNIIEWLNKVKPPYNISGPNQAEALKALSNKHLVQQQIQLIKEERQSVITALLPFVFVRKIFPSDANFLLIQVDNTDDVYQFLLDRGIVVRNRHQVIPGCIRVTIGSPDENARLVQSLQVYNETRIVSNK